MDAARRGDAALEAKKPAEAVEHFSQAIAQSPNAVSYYIKRSTAYQRSQRYNEGLQDAEVAVTLAFKRATRELIAQAQLRRGINLFHLQRYGDAKLCLEWTKKFDAKDKMAGVWESQVNGKLKGLEEGDEKARATIEENPQVEAMPTTSKQEKSSNLENPKSLETTTATKVEANTSDASAAVPTPPSQTPASKIRHEWYQNSDNVYVTLLAKGVPKDQAIISIEQRSLSITFPLTTGSSFDFSLDPLYASVDPDASSYKVLSTKIEVVLRKSSSGQKWSAIEGTSQTMGGATGIGSTSANGQSNDSAASEPTAKSPNVASQQSLPSYPTSSRTGPKNWDKIANSYTKPAESTSKEKIKSTDSGNDSESKDDSVYIDEYEDGGDEVNAFFRKLYAGASEDTRRAMMKSYQESGGTALSTNWEEVKKAPVPVSPPDGMEEKKWEY